MIASRRRLHLWVWSALLPLLVGGLVLAILLRSPGGAP